MKKVIILILCLGGAGYAAYHYRDSLGLPFGRGRTEPNTEEKIAILKREAANARSLMEDALSNGDNQTYTVLQRHIEVINLEIEALREL